MKTNYNPYHDELGRFTTQLGEAISKPKKKSKRLFKLLLEKKPADTKSRDLNKRLDNLCKMVNNQEVESV